MIRSRTEKPTPDLPACESVKKTGPFRKKLTMPAKSASPHLQAAHSLVMMHHHYLHSVDIRGGLAQLVERLVRNEKVRSSNLLISTRFNR